MTRRPRAVACLIGAAVALIALVLPWPGPVAALFRTDPTTAAPTLPAQFAPYSGLTSAVSQRPAGRAIALYEYGSSELFTTWQTLVDLATARTRTVHTVAWTSNVGADLQLLDWSTDGRYVAYAVPAPPPADGTAASSFSDGQAIEELGILDLATDTTARYPQISPVWGAVFDPSGRQLVVQTAREGGLVSITGQYLRATQLPTGAELSWGSAWSPDGSSVATVVAHVNAPATVGFIDVASGRPFPVELDVSELLGWRSSTSVLARAWVPELDADAIVEVSTVDGHRTVLSTFSRAHSCEYGLQRCSPYRIQLATALIGSVATRPSDPDRGPGLPAVGIAAAAAAGLAAGLLTPLVLRRIARRRVPDPPA